MARRRSKASSAPRGKSANEARVERITWVALVIIFGLVSLARESNILFPNWVVPFFGAVVLLGGGIYQYQRRYRVSPVTWIAGVVMLLFVLYNFYVNPAEDFLGESLVVFALIILFGVVTGET